MLAEISSNIIQTAYDQHTRVIANAYPTTIHMNTATLVHRDLNFYL